MASNTDPATLRALADRLDAFMPSVAECFLLKYTQPITDAAAALRACADAQERPATRVASMVGLSENIIVLPEAPAAPAAPDAIGDFDALPYEPKREVVRAAAPALSDDTLRAMAREYEEGYDSDREDMADMLVAFALDVLAKREGQ
jgi:hypothetical protein